MRPGPENPGPTIAKAQNLPCPFSSNSAFLFLWGSCIVVSSSRVCWNGGKRKVNTKLSLPLLFAKAGKKNWSFPGGLIHGSYLI